MTLKEQGYKIANNSWPGPIQKLWDKNYEAVPPPSNHTLRHFLHNLGEQTIKRLSLGHQLVTFFGQILVFLSSSIVGQQKPIRWVSVVHHMEHTGLRAIAIISLISLLIGAVLAYQGIHQLSRFGASIYTVDFLAISLLREISVLLTSIVIAGRSASAFAAQIGTMQLNQEIDAIRVLGFQPVQELVLPRFLALLVTLPILVLLSLACGMIGGMLIMNWVVDLPFIQFLELFKGAVSLSTFGVGMSKAPLFAIIIATVGCFRGLQVHGSAESVGAMTTQSVVESIFLVIVFDALMSILFSKLGI